MLRSDVVGEVLILQFVHVCSCLFICSILRLDLVFSQLFF